MNTINTKMSKLKKDSVLILRTDSDTKKQWTRQAEQMQLNLTQFIHYAVNSVTIKSK